MTFPGNGLPPVWTERLAAVTPDGLTAREILETIPESARTRCGFPPERIAELEEFLHRLCANEESVLRWDALRRVFSEKDPSQLFDGPFPESLAGGKTELFLLTLALGMIPFGEDVFRSRGLPPEKLCEALGEIRIWTEDCRKNFGVTGLEYENGFAWIVWRILRAEVLRFGRLEYNESHFFYDVFVFRHRISGEYRIILNDAWDFDVRGRIAAPGTRPEFRSAAVAGVFGRITGYEICRGGTLENMPVTLDFSEWECALHPADEVLFMHIPADGPLEREAVLNSLRAVWKFDWREKRNFHPKAVICDSWLFDPVLGDILPETSNLVCFQQTGRMIPNRKRDEEAIRRVFGVAAEQNGIQSVVWDTSLRRALGKYLIGGGILTGGRIVFLPEDFL